MNHRKNTFAFAVSLFDFYYEENALILEYSAWKFK